MSVIAPQDLLFLLMEAREKPAHVGGLALFETPDHADEEYLYDLYRSAGCGSPRTSSGRRSTS